MDRPSSSDLDHVERAVSRAWSALDTMTQALALPPDADDEDGLVKAVRKALEDGTALGMALEDAMTWLRPAEDWVLASEARRLVCDHCGAPLESVLADGDEVHGLVPTCLCWMDRRPRLRMALA